MAPHDRDAAAAAGATPGAIVGIGLRSDHRREVAAIRPDIGFLEIHAENYLSGAPAVAALETLRRDYPVSLHGVGLSLGSADGVDGDHLARIARLANRIEPLLVSEHLSWSSVDSVYLNDLLPLPYTDEALAVVARNVGRVQEVLGRPILIENPSRYLDFRDRDYDEPGFLQALVARTGCGILCDVNNIFVSAVNLGFDAADYLARLPAPAIGQYHLAGHSRNEVDGIAVLIDDHGSRVSPAVWRLYARALAMIGARPTLIEWDSHLPPLALLLDEARIAADAMRSHEHGGAHGVAA